MKITCDMAMDLIALYNDGIASKDSRDAVREHLLHCPACAKAYAGYKLSSKPKHSYEATGEPTAEELKAKYKNLAKNLHKRYIISTGATLLVTALSVGLGIVSYKKLKEEQRLREAARAHKSFFKTYFG